VPWAWAINAFFTVIGSVSAMILGMILGFTAVEMIAAACYGTALVAIAIRSVQLPREAASRRSGVADPTPI
jgi:hypothetical protein